MVDVEQSNTPLRHSFTTKIGFCLVHLFDICSKQVGARWYWEAVSLVLTKVELSGISLSSVIKRSALCTVLWVNIFLYTNWRGAIVVNAGYQ